MVMVMDGGGDSVKILRGCSVRGSCVCAALNSVIGPLPRSGLNSVIGPVRPR